MTVAVFNRTPPSYSSNDRANSLLSISKSSEIAFHLLLNIVRLSPFKINCTAQAFITFLTIYIYIMGFPTCKLGGGASPPPPQFLKNNFQWSHPPHFGLFLIHYSHKICTNLTNKYNNGTIHSRYTTTD